MEIIDIVIHFEEYLRVIVDLLGPWTYALLFGVIFAETGFVATPFLPGDSLLFTVGTLAGTNILDIRIVYVLLLIAAILGDSVNYWVGKRLGPKVFNKDSSRLFNKAYLEKTRLFYEKHGGKTIILARFVPIIRTFAPFVAGIGQMKYKTFLFYNVLGGFVWVTGLTFAGYFFGSLPIVRNNFEFVIFGIIFVSLVPVFIEFINHRRSKRKEDEEKTSYSKIQHTFEKEHLKE